MRQEGSAFPVAGGGEAEAGYPSAGDSGVGGEVGPSDASSSLWDSKVLCPGAQVPHLLPLDLGCVPSMGNSQDILNKVWGWKAGTGGMTVPGWVTVAGQAFRLPRPITREPGSHLALAPDPSPLGGSSVGPTTHTGDWD